MRDMNHDEAHPKSPWGLGSVSRPCSSKHLQSTITELSPHGKKWLRDVYSSVLGIKGPSANGCNVCPSARPFDLGRAAKIRAHQLRCFKKTPGLCCKDPSFGKIGPCVASSQVRSIASGVVLLRLLLESCSSLLWLRHPQLKSPLLQIPAPSCLAWFGSLRFSLVSPTGVNGGMCAVVAFAV